MDNSMNPLNLFGRRIVVTGASSGIGRAVCVYLSKMGADVVLVARNVERLNETMSMMDGAMKTAIPYDLTSHNNMTEMFMQATKDGKLNGLVHCAGVAQLLPLGMLTKERMLREMDVNYFSYIELIREFAKTRNSKDGSIVGISSIAADRAEKCQTNYAASKAAMDIASQALSIELCEKHIRINTILPGVINTQMTEKAEKTGIDIGAITSAQILGVGESCDVAAMCAFLLSDMSKFITGRRFFVDGGRFL